MNRITSSENMALSLVGVRMAEDLGVFEPQEHLQKFCPRSMATDINTGKRWYLVGPAPGKLLVADVKCNAT